MEVDILFAAFLVFMFFSRHKKNVQRTPGTSMRSCVLCGRLGNQYKQQLPITAHVGCLNNCRHRSRENRLGSQTFLDGKMLFFHMLLAPVLLARNEFKNN